MIHYIHDISLANKNKDQTEETLRYTTQQLTDNGLFIAPDKIQHNKHLNHLGKVIYDDYIMPQKMNISLDKLKALNNFQRLLGNINWVLPHLNITTGELHVLFKALKGDPNPKSKGY